MTSRSVAVMTTKTMSTMRNCLQADVIRKEIAIYSVRGHWLPYILCQKGTIMSEIKEYIIKIEVENEQNAHFETDIFGKDLDVLKEAVPRTISEICRDNGINGRISTRIEITADGEYFDSDEADLYAEYDTIWSIETYLYNRGDVEKGSVHHDVINPEMLKRSMQIRSSIITGYPNPCAYTDRYHEEYNALAVYLAIHYPKDNELSTYAPVFNEISTWDKAVGAAYTEYIVKLIAADEDMEGYFGTNELEALRAFYYGKLDSAGEPGPLWDEIRVKTDELVKDKDEIIKLFPHAKGLVERVSEKSVDICSMQLYNEFAKGFKLGMQLTVEGMSKHRDALPGKIYTHDEASRILEAFEDVLSRYNIHVPSPEDDEREPDDLIGLYGSTYSELLDDIESRLIDLISAAKSGAEVITDVYSGSW